MAKPPIELEVGYYLNNFEKLLSFIEEVYLDLLQKEEKDFLKAFKSCSTNTQRLYVRLVLRKKSFFRRSKLNYSEIDLDSAVREGGKTGLFCIDPEIEYPDILEPFTVTEIKSFYKSLDRGGKKKNVIKREDLLSVCEPYEAEVQQWVLNQDQLIWPMYGECVEKFQLLFFGNLYQDMAQFILEDVGVMKFEKSIKIDKTTRYFSGREHLEAHYHWFHLHTLLWEAGEARDLDKALEILKELKKIKFKGESYLRKVSRSFNLVAKLYESEGDLVNAKKLFEKSLIEPARERRVRILEKLDKDKLALKLCEEITNSPWSEHERYFGEFFREKLKKKLGLAYEKRKKLSTPKEEVLPLKWDKDDRVENQVLSFLTDQGYTGFFCENDYWGTLTALLFWEEFWSPGPGVFYHPFEPCPRDFSSGEFYERMQSQIEKKCLWWQKQTDWWKVLEPKYDQKFLTHCSLASWKKTEKENLKMMVEYTPKEWLISVSLQMLKDPKQYRSGLPDLFLLDSYKKVFLGEVKSPNDQVQSSQKKWFDFFIEKGIPFVIYRL